jgi:hypothetical protein
MTMDLIEMFKKYEYHDASCFGHALEGNLHLVFSQVGGLRVCANNSCVGGRVEGASLPRRDPVHGRVANQAFFISNLP